MFRISLSLHTFPSQVALSSFKRGCFTDTSILLTQSQALLKAIREYDASKWKVIGAKVGKPAKVCP